MRLYHSTFLLFIFGIIASGCSPTPVPTQAVIGGTILVDGQLLEFEQPPGSTVQEAIDSLDITLDLLDIVTPQMSSVLNEDIEISITRVREEFEIEEVEIPFDQKRLPTELLPEGVERYDPLQKGEPGLQEITYRIVYENGIEVSRTQIKSTVVLEPQSQIILFGTQQKHSPIKIPGKLLYLSKGNAIMIEDTTANRIPVVNTGDLDGRIFSLSDDGEWLLFTRRSDDEDIINSLWAVNLVDSELTIDLQVDNVVHFSDWYPESNKRIVYSTVEPRQAAPGWQANNNLLSRNFSLNGWVDTPITIIETNFGGVYGWWGTDYLYAPDDSRLAYVSPDKIGILNFDEEIQDIVFDITPYQTRSDWAWVSGVSWSPDGSVLYHVNHAPPPGSISPEESPNFDLTALLLGDLRPITFVSQVGMFAYPLPSPVYELPSGENSYQLAYLQAIFPDQSDTSRYRLTIIDRDGSNRREIFPAKEFQGIEPRKNWGRWSPVALEKTGSLVVAVIYQGDIWFIDPVTEDFWQVTGDGSIDRLLWQ